MYHWQHDDKNNGFGSCLWWKWAKKMKTSVTMKSTKKNKFRDNFELQRKFCRLTLQTFLFKFHRFFLVFVLHITNGILLRSIFIVILFFYIHKKFDYNAYAFGGSILKFRQYAIYECCWIKWKWSERTQKQNEMYKKKKEHT